MTAPTMAPSATRNLRLTAFSVFGVLLLIAVYTQSIFAGVFLSGKVWGRDAHQLNGGIVILAALIGGILALVTLTDVPKGRRFGIRLIAFAIGLAIQYAIGMRVSDGDRLLWLHIPFGVALIGMSADLAKAARELGR